MVAAAAAAEHVTAHKSPAEDLKVDPTGRKTKHSFQRFVNSVSGTMEVSGQQAVASMLGLHAWVSTDQFVYLHTDATTAFLRGLLTTVSHQKEDPFKHWVESNDDYNSDEDSDYYPSSDDDASNYDDFTEEDEECRRVRGHGADLPGKRTAHNSCSCHRR